MMPVTAAMMMKRNMATVERFEGNPLASSIMRMPMPIRTDSGTAAIAMP